MNSYAPSKKLLVFAQECEALPTINLLHAQPIPNEYKEIYSEGVRPSCYHFSEGWIILTSRGSLAAAQSVAKYLHKYDIDEIINIGFAASLENEAQIGEIHKILSADKYQLLPGKIDPGSRDCYQALYPQLLLSKEGKRLLTSDYPIHNKTLKKNLQNEWELIDMEGYGIVHTAHAFKKSVSLYKIVSDFASAGGRGLIQQHKKTLAETLAGFMHHHFPHASKIRADF